MQNKMFDRKQFVTDANLAGMCSPMQKLAALELHVNSANQQKLFWEDHGRRAMARNAICEKGQPTQNSMKLAFQGK